MSRRLSVAGAAVSVVTLGAAGCGGSGAPKSATFAGTSQQLAVAKCMRAHGITTFPDPVTGAGGQGFLVSAAPGSETVTVDGTAFSGPAFTAAARKCDFAGGGPRPVIEESQKLKLLAFARCMRAHGIHWADPTFPPGGGIAGGGPSNRAAQPAPALQRAAKRCNHQVGL